MVLNNYSPDQRPDMIKVESNNGNCGVFPVQLLQKAVQDGAIVAEQYKIPSASFQPASLDLRLAEEAYRLRCSFLPDTKSVEDKLPDFMMEKFSLVNGAILERNRPYLIPLVEGLKLPKNIRAKTNPRSSTGRLDIFTRVITDFSHRFDEIRPGYEGKLYLEVLSRTFTIKVKRLDSLNQIRLLSGESHCSDKDLSDYHKQKPIIYEDGLPLHQNKLVLSNGLLLGVDLKGNDKGTVAYRARKNSLLLDLSKMSYYDPSDFWEPQRAEREGCLILEPEDFYLIRSKEFVRITPDFAAEMAAYDPTSGELRTHYAGFFDPGFGYGSKGQLKGTRAVLELRAHDVPFSLEHGQKVCKLEFHKMCESPVSLYGEDIGSSYQDQELTFSKHFRRSGDHQPYLL